MRHIIARYDGPDHLELWLFKDMMALITSSCGCSNQDYLNHTKAVAMYDGKNMTTVSHGLQLQSLWRAPTAAVS